MSKAIELLSLLNSKERFFLLGYALGNRNFNPSLELRGDINKAFGLTLPQSVFATMDFHLDWIFAAMKLSSVKEGDTVFPIEPACITATQEDIDFLIAFDEGNLCHIILLEAKGVTGWTNTQMDSKARRFGEMFGKDGRRWSGVVPHFAIVSPRPSQRLSTHLWPEWMAPGGVAPWIELSGTGGHSRVHRCNPEGVETKDGGHWTIAHR